MGGPLKPVEQVYGRLTTLQISPSAKPTKALVLLHGVGSNETDLLGLAPLLSDDRLIVSIRAPIEMAPRAFAWFHVQFTESGPMHTWSEAETSLFLIEDALADLSKRSGIPLSQISVFGFSQGAIMTIGLALTSKLNLKMYIASSGRTLPEIASLAQLKPLAEPTSRHLYLTHGVSDSKLPIRKARETKEILQSKRLQLTYKEYDSGHTITPELLCDAKKWLSSK